MNFYEARIGAWSCTSNNKRWLWELVQKAKRRGDVARIYLNGEQVWPKQMTLFDWR